VKRLAVLCIAVATGLTACGSKTDSGSDKAQPPGAHRSPSQSPQREVAPTHADPTPLPQPQTGELTAGEKRRVKKARIRILDYCEKVLSYLAEDRPGPGDLEFGRKTEAVNTLIALARREPKATYSNVGPMEDVLVGSASEFETDNCDKESARRLRRTARSLR
jgi:hypothetical protein